MKRADLEDIGDGLGGGESAEGVGGINGDLGSEGFDERLGPDVVDSAPAEPRRAFVVAGIAIAGGGGGGRGHDRNNDYIRYVREEKKVTEKKERGYVLLRNKDKKV